MQRSSASTNEDSLDVINLTPLADVTLVLLIMLMVLSPMALQSMIQVQAAQVVAASNKNSIPEKPIFVDVTGDGFTLNGQPMPSEYDLFRSLQRTLYGHSDRTVLISSVPEVKYERVVRVLDLVRQSGAVSLSLVPRKKEAS